MYSIKKQRKSIILVSGGMDSCVTAAIANEKGLSLSFLHINYGQLTEERELTAFHEIADYYNVNEKLIIDIPHFNLIGGSCLTDKSIKVPKAKLDNNNIPISYVPFRNANILSIAVSWAEVIKATTIYIGAVAEDSSGYPDCRTSFFNAFEKVINLGTKPNTNISINTPIIDLTKKQIIKQGLKLKAPLELTWSCYQNKDKPCQQCDSCALRQRGFKQAGIADPLLSQT